ncbi:ankyrin repeat domain-containing protein [Verrucomicrobiota bacterium]
MKQIIDGLSYAHAHGVVVIISNFSGVVYWKIERKAAKEAYQSAQFAESQHQLRQARERRSKEILQAREEEAKRRIAESVRKQQEKEKVRLQEMMLIPPGSKQGFALKNPERFDAQIEAIYMDVDVNKRYGSDDPPLIHAIKKICWAYYGGQAHIDVLKSLIVRGADVNAQNKRSGQTPLIEAASQNQLDMVIYFVDKGADVNARTKSGNTPLIAAVSSHNPNMVIYLLNKGADVNGKNREKMDITPLMKAVKNKDLFMVKILLDKGADVNAKNMIGTVLKNSSYWEIPNNIIEFLKYHGAKE